MTDRTEDRSEQPPRKPYGPPRILDSAEFETLALSCAKIDPYDVGNPCDIAQIGSS